MYRQNFNQLVRDRLTQQNEKEKEEKFQKIFKELWPNTYSIINEPLRNTTKRPCASKDDPCFVKCKKCDHLSWYNCVRCVEKPAEPQESEMRLQDYYSKYLSNTNPSLNTFQTQNSDRLNTISKRESDYLNAIKTHKYSNAVSAYDTPFLVSNHSDKLVGSLYNDESLSNEIKLLQDIKESNEKLRIHGKIEKTNHLVDDIIKKVEVIHAEIKKKQAEIRVKENLESLKLEAMRRRERSSSPRARSSSQCESTHRNHYHHHCSIHEARPTTSILKKSSTSPCTRSHSRVCFRH